MKRLYPRIYSFQFRNLLKAYRRNCSYLCFQVERVQCPSPVFSDRGVFRNQFYKNEYGSYHAELCFLSWFHDMKLSPDEYYHITWFLSWSPCATCAEEIAIFLRTHLNVKLRIFTSRLYYYWHPAFCQGLQELYHLGTRIEIMSFQDFNSCWENFVFNRQMRFRCWKKVHRNYRILTRELYKMLSC